MGRMQKNIHLYYNHFIRRIPSSVRNIRGISGKYITMEDPDRIRSEIMTERKPHEQPEKTQRLLQ